MRRDLISEVMREMGGKRVGRQVERKAERLAWLPLHRSKRSELARKAVKARWARVKKKAKLPAKTQGG